MAVTRHVRGFAFPFRRGTSGFPEGASDDALIHDALVQLMLTAVGERTMRPELGTRLFALVHENNDALLGELVRTELLSVVGRYEPRVQLTDVQVSRDRDAATVTVDVEYVVRATGTSSSASLTLGATP